MRQKDTPYAIINTLILLPTAGIRCPSPGPLELYMLMARVTFHLY